MRLAWLALLAAIAQASPASVAHRDAQPGGDLVRIDVIVRDGQGRPVETLKPSDFELREDQTPQTLAGAQFVRDSPRQIAIYLDEYYVSPSSTARVRTALHHLVDGLGASDSAVVLRPLDSLLKITMTRDHAALHRAIDAFEGRRGDYAPRTAFERDYLVSDKQRADVQRAQSTWSTMNALALHLANLGAGRASLLLVSEYADPVFRRRGFEGLPTSTSVTRTANRSNVSIYTFDPRDVVERGAAADEGPNLLRVLADDTDGAAFSGPVAADAGLQQMLNDASSYYLLTYRSARSRDGLFHAVTVVVKRPGVKVRARTGYWAPTPDEIERANLLAHARDPLPPPKLEPPRHASTLIRPWFGIARGDNGRIRMTFVWEPTGPVPGDRHVKVPAVLEVKVVGADGATAFQGSVRERASAVFDVPPGRVTFTSSVQDAALQAIDSDLRDVIVRDLRGVLVLGTPQVFRARTALDMRELRADPAAVPAAAREFSRAEHLLIRVPAYAASQPPAITATLISPAKQPMRKLAVDAAAAPGGLTQIDLPLASLAPGQYSVEIAAKAGTGTAKDSVAFRVTN